MKTLKKIVLLSFIFSRTAFHSFAQTENEDHSLYTKIEKESATAIDAIAMYPEDVRNNIFTACMYPELIARISSMQANTNEEFKSLLSPYSKYEQEKIWNMTRYPELISKIVDGGKKSKEEINKILDKYPPEIDETAIEQGTKNYDLLVKIDHADKRYNENFNEMLKGYQPSAVAAYKALLKNPQVLSTLSENMHMTVVVGDIYRRNPDLITQHIDSLNYVLTQNSKKETAEWQQSMDKNPEAKKQYEMAAKEYALENGYYSQNYSTQVVVNPMNYYAYPYNWWFGYPYWYQVACWRPYPYWYDWGFYYGYNYQMMYFGMPSHRFFDWYYHHHYHHYQYAYFSNHCYNYYNSHTYASGYNPVCRSVNEWQNGNRMFVSKDWNCDDAHRIALFQEYGKMENERDKFNATNPQKTMNQIQYYQMNKNDYPTLTNAVNIGRTEQPAVNENHNAQQMNPNSPLNPVQNFSTSKPASGTVQSERNSPQNNIQPQYNNPTDNKPQQNDQLQNNNNVNRTSNVDAQHYPIERNVQPTYNNPVYKPSQVEAQHYNPQYNNPQRNAPEYTTPQPQRSYTPPPTQNIPQYRNAQEIHRSTWNQIQSSPAPSRPVYMAPPPSRPVYNAPAPARPQMQMSPPSRNFSPATPSRGGGR